VGSSFVDFVFTLNHSTSLKKLGKENTPAYSVMATVTKRKRGVMTLATGV
jgi:hypothetical protein